MTASGVSHRNAIAEAPLSVPGLGTNVGSAVRAEDLISSGADWPLPADCVFAGAAAGRGGRRRRCCRQVRVQHERLEVCPLNVMYRPAVVLVPIPDESFGVKEGLGGARSLRRFDDCDEKINAWHVRLIGNRDDVQPRSWNRKID